MYTIYTKDNCPHCVEAKALLTANQLSYTEVKVTTASEVQRVVAGAETVPQILLGDKLIGGCDSLKTYLSRFTRTVFNTNNSGYTTGKYPLFLGDAPGFTDSIVQPYPVIDKIYQLQVSQIWNETEVNLTRDRMDMLAADPKVVDFSVQNLMYQTLVDSAASRAITGVLMEYVSNTDLEAAYNSFGLFETIHARSYLHIIKQTMVDPVQALKEGYANKHILARAEPTVRCFDALANAKPGDPELEEKLYLALVALYLLESISFPASFSCTFAVSETGILQGVSQVVALILRDESLHSLLGREVLKIDRDKWIKYKNQVAQLYDEVIAGELAWNQYLFSEGRQVIGLTPQLSEEYIHYLAKPVVEVLELERRSLDKNPLPYMEKYIDTSKVQIANQELENGTYLLNSILAAEDMAKTLKELQNKHKGFL